MTSRRRAVENETRLRRRDRQVFAGNPAAASPAARPISPGATFVGSGGGTAGPFGTVSGQLLRVRADAYDVASGGQDIEWQTQADRTGFASTAALPTTDLVAPFDGFYIMSFALLWDDPAFTDGALVEVIADPGTASEEVVVTLPAGGFGSTPYGNITAIPTLRAGQTFRVKVTQTSGATETADGIRLDVAAFRVGLSTVTVNVWGSARWDAGTWSPGTWGEDDWDTGGWA